MKQIDFALTRPQLAGLSERGLKLHGLANARKLDAASRIEGPTSILSTVAGGAYLDVGAFCNLSGGTINNARIGRYSSMASGAVIGQHEHPTDWLTTSRVAYYPQVNGWDALMVGGNAAAIRAKKRPFADGCPITTLGPDVWIGQGAFIKSGVNIGVGAIIGARATVLRDVPPYAIVVGTPGRVLRLRFPDPIVERLLALAWWRYCIYDVFDAPFDDVAAAIDVLEDKVSSGVLLPYEAPEISAADLADPEVLLQALELAPIARAM